MTMSLGSQKVVVQGQLLRAKELLSKGLTKSSSALKSLKAAASNGMFTFSTEEMGGERSAQEPMPHSQGLFPSFRLTFIWHLLVAWSYSKCILGVIYSQQL